jgi:uncharacterized protein DUF6893
MKALRIARNVVGSAGLVFVGYLFLNVLPDLRRYLRITAM